MTDIPTYLHPFPPALYCEVCGMQQMTTCHRNAQGLMDVEFIEYHAADCPHYKGSRDDRS